MQISKISSRKISVSRGRTGTTTKGKVGHYGKKGRINKVIANRVRRNDSEIYNNEADKHPLKQGINSDFG